MLPAVLLLPLSLCHAINVPPNTPSQTVSHFAHAIWWIKAPVAWPALPLYMA